MRTTSYLKVKGNNVLYIIMMETWNIYNLKFLVPFIVAKKFGNSLLLGGRLHCGTNQLTNAEKYIFELEL